MQRKWPLLIGALVLACAMAGASVWWYRAREAKLREAAAKQAAAKAAAAALTVPHGDISLQGVISARDLVDVPAPVNGRVIRFHAEPGDEVYQGQLLAEINNQSLMTAHEQAATELERAQERVNTLEASVAAARLETSRAQADYLRVKAELERAARNWSRQKMLLAEGATPRQVFERAEAEYKTLQGDFATREEVAKSAEARFDSLQKDLDNARKELDRKGRDLEAAKERVDAGQVISPVSGVVVSRRGAPGDEVHPAMTDLFRLATDLSNLSVTVEPLPAALVHIKAGMPALVLIADVPGEALGGVVRTVDHGRVVIDFSNPGPLVRPGTTAQVRLRLP